MDSDIKWQTVKNLPGLPGNRKSPVWCCFIFLTFAQASGQWRWRLVKMKIVFALTVLFFFDLHATAQFPQFPESGITVSPFVNLGPVINVPTCSYLESRDGLFYLEKDTIPYCGVCVVVSTVDKAWFPYFGERPVTDPGRFLYLKVNSVHPYFKIISNYSNGKRHGDRLYFNIYGKLRKTEKYNEGTLIETVYP